MLRYSLVAVLVVGLLVAATPALAATEAPGFGPQLQLQQMTKEQVRQQLREMHTELKGTCEPRNSRSTSCSCAACHGRTTSSLARLTHWR